MARRGLNGKGIFCAGCVWSPSAPMVIFGMLHGKLSRFLALFSRHKSRENTRLHPSGLPSPFHTVFQIAELHDFFYNFNLDADPFLQADGPLPGYCIVCDQQVLFEVNRPSDGSPVNWRETLKCPQCGMINRWRGCLHLFEEICGPKGDSRVYLTEALTPIAGHLKTRYPGLTSSEYLAGVETGTVVQLHGKSIRNEDVTRLTFADQSFDTVLCFDVLEHVPDYRAAISEFHRVLDWGGHLILTAPFSFQQETVVRAILEPDGEVKHLVEPCYHGDPLSDEGVLAYYDFGMELLDELKAAGFGQNSLVCYNSNEWGYPGANVAFVSRKVK